MSPIRLLVHSISITLIPIFDHFLPRKELFLMLKRIWIVNSRTCQDINPLKWKIKEKIYAGMGGGKKWMETVVSWAIKSEDITLIKNMENRH